MGDSLVLVYVGQKDLRSGWCNPEIKQSPSLDFQ